MKRKGSLYLAGVVLLALALRLPRFLTAQVVLTEGTTYTTIARNLAAGRGYIGILGVWDFFVPPLYPLLISLLIRLGLDALWAGRLLSLILGALLPLPIYWLTRELSGRRLAGLFAALFIAFHPLLIVYAGRVWSETTYSFLVWCGLCWAWAALTRRRWPMAALAGICFGAAYLTRHEGAVYFTILFALLVTVEVWEKAQGRKEIEEASSSARLRLCDPATPLMRMAAALMAFALLAAPYVVWLSGQAGRFMWETKSVPNFVTAQRMATGMSYMEAAYGLTATGEPAGPFLFRNELLRNPPTDGGPPLAVRLRGALNGLVDEVRLLLTEIASPLALLLALLGLLWSALGRPLSPTGDGRGRGRTIGRSRNALAGLPNPAESGGFGNPPRTFREVLTTGLAGTGFLLAFLLPSLATVSLLPRVYPRYLTPVIGYVALWSGMALAAGYRWVRRRWNGRRRWMRAALLSALLLVLAVALHTIQGGVLAFRPPRVVLDLDLRSAGEWLAAYDPSPQKRIMSVHSQLPFYAGGVHVPMPYAEPELVQRYAEARGVDYVVVSPRKLRSRPPLEPWAREEAIPEGWRFLYRDAETGLAIYQAQTHAP